MCIVYIIMFSSVSSAIPTTAIPTTTTATTSTPPTTTSTPTPTTDPKPYSYLQYIKSPSEMGMSDAGNLPTIERDINGLISYVKLLVDGPSPASKAPNNGPLGNRFFVKTSAKCNATIAGIPTEVDRYIYIDNIPKGGIGAAPGANLPEFRGLIPGMMSGLDVLNPSRIAESISNSTSPECISVTLDVLDISSNTTSSATNFVALADAQYIDPCSFTACVNPATGGTCKQGFTTRSELLFSEIETDHISQAFIFSFGLVGIFILHLLLNRRFRY
jgi:hypothetical protein